MIKSFDSNAIETMDDEMAYLIIYCLNITLDATEIRRLHITECALDDFRSDFKKLHAAIRKAL